MNLAQDAEFCARYTVTHAVAVGSPVDFKRPADPRTWVASVTNQHDIVPTLDGQGAGTCFDLHPDWYVVDYFDATHLFPLCHSIEHYMANLADDLPEARRRIDGRLAPFRGQVVRSQAYRLYDRAPRPAESPSSRCPPTPWTGSSCRSGATTAAASRPTSPRTRPGRRHCWRGAGSGPPYGSPGEPWSPCTPPGTGVRARAATASSTSGSSCRVRGGRGCRASLARSAARGRPAALGQLPGRLRDRRRRPRRRGTAAVGRRAVPAPLEFELTTGYARITVGGLDDRLLTLSGVLGPWLPVSDRDLVGYAGGRRAPRCAPAYGPVGWAACIPCHGSGWPWRRGRRTRWPAGFASWASTAPARCCACRPPPARRSGTPPSPTGPLTGRPP